MSITPDNPAQGPDIPPELLNEYLYGLHICLDDGEEESFVDPNAPSFTGVRLTRELLKSKVPIRVLRSANSPSPSYRAKPAKRRSAARLV